MANRKAALPALPANTPRELRPFLTALREQMQVTAGHGRGSTLDRALTLRDLQGGELGDLITRSAQQQVVRYFQDGSSPDAEAPTTPTNVVLVANSQAVMATWDVPSFVGYSHTLVYRTPWDGVNQPGFNVNFLIGSDYAGFYDVTTQADTDYVYWFRHVNVNGAVGPLSASAGHAIKTGTPINLQEGWVTVAMLEAALASRIDLIDQPGGLSERLTTIEQDYVQSTDLTQFVVDDENYSAVETAALAAADNAQYTIRVENDGNVAGIGLSATDTTTAILFSADQIGFKNTGDLATGDVLPFTVKNNKVYMENAVISRLEAARIVNESELVDENGVDILTGNTAFLGHTLISGRFYIGRPGQIHWKDLHPVLREKLLIKQDEVVGSTGGTRTRIAQNVPGLVGTSVYMAVTGGTEDTATLFSSGKKIVVNVDVVGGVPAGSRKTGTQIAPSVTFNVKRKKLSNGVVETIASNVTLTGERASQQVWVGAGGGGTGSNINKDGVITHIP